MAMYGQGATRGKVAILGIDAATNQACAAIIPKREKIDPSYLYSVLAFKYKEIRELGHGGNQKNLNTSLIREIPIPVPPLSRQREIAEIAQTWEAAIEKTERLIETSEQRNQSLARALLFGKRRLGNRSSPMNRALHWFHIPSDWKSVEFGALASEVSISNSDGKKLPVLSCTKHEGLVNSLEYFDRQVFSHDTSNYKVVRNGQFAYATNHIEEGSIGYQNLCPVGLVSPIYTVFQTDRRKIDDGYLYRLLKTEAMRRLFEAHTNSSVDRRGSLRWKDFAQIHIPLPSLYEQGEISALLDEATRELSLLKAHLVAFKDQEQGLLQKLLSGQFRLKLPVSAVT